ncbi:hypothetical protein IMZ29_17420 [Achromobacter sp. GG226]|uniref:hypothetical protein n=1 Tax=Verticiella alkaliphila TaxID=2779529 RepID=UPI001C0AD2F4|nr:hypothetical protein [Verticiella sp. GG226]MBU4612257.1 hypothetical protein [Verticiella sp. GG226]
MVAPRRVPLPSVSAALRLLVVALIGLLACTLAVGYALKAPWLGLTLVPDATGAVWVTQARGPADGMTTPARLQGVGVPMRRCDGCHTQVEMADIRQDPGMLASAAARQRFYERQSELAELLAQPAVAVYLTLPEGARVAHTVSPSESRPLNSLPMRFWWQLAGGLFALLVGAGVWTLRPKDWAARLVALTGALTLGLVLPAAVYGARELALPAPFFSTLSVASMTVTILCAVALIGSVLCVPGRFRRRSIRLVAYATGTIALTGIALVAAPRAAAPILDGLPALLHVDGLILLLVTYAVTAWVIARGWRGLDRATAPAA